MRSAKGRGVARSWEGGEAMTHHVSIDGMSDEEIYNAAMAGEQYEISGDDALIGFSLGGAWKSATKAVKKYGRKAVGSKLIQYGASGAANFIADSVEIILITRLSFSNNPASSCHSQIKSGCAEIV